MGRLSITYIGRLRLRFVQSKNTLKYTKVSIFASLARWRKLHFLSQRQTRCPFSYRLSIFLNLSEYTLAPPVVACFLGAIFAAPASITPQPYLPSVAICPQSSSRGGWSGHLRLQSRPLSCASCPTREAAIRDDSPELPLVSRQPKREHILPCQTARSKPYTTWWGCSRSRRHSSRRCL